MILDVQIEESKPVQQMNFYVAFLFFEIVYYQDIKRA